MQVSASVFKHASHCINCTCCGLLVASTVQALSQSDQPKGLSLVQSIQEQHIATQIPLATAIFETARNTLTSEGSVYVRSFPPIVLVFRVFSRKQATQRAGLRGRFHSSDLYPNWKRRLQRDTRTSLNRRTLVLRSATNPLQQTLLRHWTL